MCLTVSVWKSGVGWKIPTAGIYIGYQAFDGEIYGQILMDQETSWTYTWVERTAGQLSGHIVCLPGPNGRWFSEDFRGLWKITKQNVLVPLCWRRIICHCVFVELANTSAPSYKNASATVCLDLTAVDALWSDEWHPCFNYQPLLCSSSHCLPQNTPYISITKFSSVHSWHPV